VKNAYGPWLRLYRDAWRLGFESAAVVGLRMMKIAQGGAAAESEKKRMVTEKIQAGLDLQRRALTGGLGMTPKTAAARTVSHYRKRVRANRRRLKS
jgi:hypothetical protein